jgi:nicotinamidase/pyrazinamidase
MVVNTADWHSKSSKELSDKPDFINTFPPHCIMGEEGADFIEETYPKTLKRGYYILNYIDKTINSDKFLFGKVKDIIILKDAFDVFDGNILTQDMVEFLNPDEIIVYGVATNVCVDKAVRGLAIRGFNVKVVVDAIKELPGIKLDSIFNLWSFMDVDFITTEDVLQRE